MEKSTESVKGKFLSGINLTIKPELNKVNRTGNAKKNAQAKVLLRKSKVLKAGVTANS